MAQHVRRALVAVPLLLAPGAATLRAQSVWDAGASAAPQFASYSLDAPVGQKISELSLPIFVVVPVSPALTLDVGTSYTSARVETASGPDRGVSQISGFTDTQVRGTYTFGNDFVVLTGGINLPTGRETATGSEQIAAGRIGSDFLAFPITAMGTGFGGTAGLAVARPWRDWNVGFGASMRVSSAYDPYQDPSGARLRFEPGNEYRVRIGADRPLGTGRVTVGLTYSTFGNDVAGGSIYNTGDRYVAQAAATNSVAGHDVTVAGWDLYRASGTLADGTAVGFDNVANAVVAVAFHPRGVRVEPSLELRNWQRDAYLPSTLATVGVRSDFVVDGLGVTPSAGWTWGRLAGPASSTSATLTTAAMTGFRVVVAIRYE